MSSKKRLGQMPALVSGAASDFWDLRLYVAGKTLKSERVIQQLRAICETYLTGHYRLEIVDLVEKPEMARLHQILAIPTVERQSPVPIRKIVGDLSNTERVLAGLEVRSA